MKRKKDKQDDPFKEERRAGGIFQLLLAWFFIPLIFAVAVLLIIAKVADVDVVEKAKEWTSSIPALEEKKQQNSAKKDEQILEERAAALKEEVKQKEQQLLDIQEDLKKSNEKNEKLVLEQERLKAQILVLQRTSDEKKKDVGQIVSTYEKMSAKSSAAVISKMEEAQALQLLSQMKVDTLAAVLEKMSPEDAAKYTALLAK
ncbi:hypothetical protein NCCP2716_02980 [Sporosarcina sp. NCCP-2716]|uniref:MotE family protein n=1 Tax=Sporosarcina sp. NCCP-2716 TaxID=2943679 RepID=UPI00203FD453|nr:hypothetical protein [Sporosarcina sp. NCCP-2716]GKV67800.1 hypothetical protein NCCP2716_02980 [Sporosarcina sp. NCCP-2716]